VGGPALPALLKRTPPNMRHEDAGVMAPPAPVATEVVDSSGNVAIQPNELAAWTVERHPGFELGTVYTVIAGLLNVLVICDAYAGPLVLVPRKKEKDVDESPGDGGGQST
jgi:hypothetical protein